MGLFDFVKEAGASMFGGGEKEEQEQAKLRDLEDVLADKRKGEALEQLVANMKINVDKFDVRFREGCATLNGCADSQDARERVVLLVGTAAGMLQMRTGSRL